jgi:Mn-containing catalase
MKKIEMLSEMIEDEIRDAEKYARKALECKDVDKASGDLFFKLANDELGHMGLLHARVVAMIEDYKKNNGEPPEAMLMLYEILHRRHMENAAAVKGMLELCK